MTAPTEDRVFDRIPSPPSQSWRYTIRRAGVPRALERIEVHWGLTPDFPLNQSEEGACVGFGISAELSADPIMLPTGTPFAFRLYELAREQDRAMGLAFPEGATVLGGLRAALKLGQIQGFAWAQTSDELLDAVLGHGSVVLGTNWYSGMDQLTPEGLARIRGWVRGGHCYTIIGYVPRFPVRDRTTGAISYFEVYELINSWGSTYGKNGRFYMLRADVDRLVFAENGEAAIVTDTPIVPTPIPRWRVALAQLKLFVGEWGRFAVGAAGYGRPTGERSASRSAGPSGCRRPRTRLRRSPARPRTRRGLRPARSRWARARSRTAAGTRTTGR